MACEINSGRKEPCKSVGGLKAIYIANWNDSLTFIEDANELITAFSVETYIHKFELRGANSFDEAGETSSENGTAFYTTTGTVQLKRQDAVTRKELKLLAYGRPRVITEDWNGDFKIYGIYNGCNVSVSTASGAGMGDFSGYNLTISAMEVEPAKFIDSNIIGDDTNTSIVEGL